MSGGRMVWGVALGFLLLPASEAGGQAQTDADRAAKQRVLRQELVTKPEPAGCPVVPSAASVPMPIRKTDFVQVERIAGGWGAGWTYTVRISGDGNVTWDGLNAANFRGSPHHRIDSAKARELIGQFQQHGFFGYAERIRR